MEYDICVCTLSIIFSPTPSQPSLFFWLLTRAHWIFITKKCVELCYICTNFGKKRKNMTSLKVSHYYIFLLRMSEPHICRFTHMQGTWKFLRSKALMMCRWHTWAGKRQAWENSSDVCINISNKFRWRDMSCSECHHLPHTCNIWYESTQSESHGGFSLAMHDLVLVYLCLYISGVQIIITSIFK